MHDAKIKKSLKQIFVTRTTLAKKLNKPVSTIERLLFREIILPDAWVIETRQSHPLFNVDRLPEIKGDMERYFSQLEKARL